MNKVVVALVAILVVFFGMGSAAHAGPSGERGRPPGPPYGGRPGVVTVSPPTVAPGGTITISVSNCTPGERVDISVAGISVSVTCGADSVASATIAMPSTPGSYTGTAVGSVSGSNMTFVVTVLAPVVPPGGLPGTGSGGVSTTTGMAGGFLAIGLGLFGVSQLRRRQAAIS